MALLLHNVVSDRRRRRGVRTLRPIKPSRRVELWYHAKLSAIVSQLRRAGAAVVAELKDEWATLEASKGPATDAATGEVTQLRVVDGRLVRVVDGVPPGLPRLMQLAAGKFAGVKAVAEKLAGIAVKQNLAEVDERVAASIKQAVGVDLRGALTASGPIATEMARARQDNVELITSIPEQYLEKVRDAVVEHWNAGKSFDSLAERVQEIGDVTDSRAELIARDQTGKMNSTFNQVRQVSLGVEKYEWQTAGDERVRDSHLAMDGQEFPWSDPPEVDGERVHPGQAINCRCVGAPVVNLDALEANASAMEEEAEAA